MSHDGDSTDSEEPTPGAGAIRTRYEWSRDETPSAAVVAAVAAATDRDPTDLPPLHGHVDADALDDVTSNETVRVTFAYAGRTVVVDADGWIEVAPLAGE